MGASDMDRLIRYQYFAGRKIRISISIMEYLHIDKVLLLLVDYTSVWLALQRRLILCMEFSFFLNNGFQA